MALDDYLETEDAQPETDSDEPSTTYIEFNSRDHPEAYRLVSQNGTIRSTFPAGEVQSVHHFYALLTSAIGEAMEEGDHLPALRFLGPSEDEVRAYLDELESEDE